MKKLMFICMLFVSSAFAVEVHVEDCAAYAESNNRDVTKVATIDGSGKAQSTGTSSAK